MKTENCSLEQSNAAQGMVSNPSPRSAWRVIKRVLYGLVLILCAFLVVVTVTVAVQRFVFKSPVPSFAGYSLLIIGTGSMENTIMEGDLVLVKDTGEYKIGDIVTFAHPGDRISTTHRIIDYEYDENGNREYVTRGDANNTKDRVNTVDEEIFGEVVWIMHGLGLFVGWLTQGGGIVFVLAAFAVIVLGVLFMKDDNSSQQESEPSKEEDGDRGEEITQKADSHLEEQTEDDTKDQLESEDQNG